MTDLAVRNVTHPASGEVLDLSGPDEDLAKTLYEIRGLESQLRELKNLIGRELHDRMDKDASWTRRAGGYEIKGTSPAPKTEYDGNELALCLSLLVENEKVTKEAAEAALETVVSYKPKKAGINKLLKLGGEVAEGIRHAQAEVEVERKAPSVKKAGT